MAKKNEESTTEGQAPAAPMPAPYPAFNQTPLGQRMAQMNMGADGSVPVWANPAMTPYTNNPTPFGPGVPASTPFGGTPPATLPGATPPTKVPSAEPAPESAMGASPWAAANPLAGPGEAPRLGDDIRTDIFRQIYRTGKRSDTPAGGMLMNIGKPPVPESDPLAGLGQAPETKPDPFYLDSAGNKNPPSGGIAPDMTPQPPSAVPTSGRRAGPAGRFAAKFGALNGLSQRAGAPVAQQSLRGNVGPAFQNIQRRDPSTPSRGTRTKPPIVRRRG